MTPVKKTAHLRQTYILRLLVESGPAGQPPEQHGALQAIDDQVTYPFKTGQGLLELLQRLAKGKNSEQPADVQEEKR